MDVPVPAIYVHGQPAERLNGGFRAIALLIAAACLSVLGVAAYLEPSPTGVGTHRALGYHPCDLLRRTGLPCPSCGMTTSFSHFARGNLLASLYVQPMGTVLALLTTACFWIAVYIGLTGKPALRLLRFVPASYYLIPLMVLGIAAWGWKMFIVARGIDGWR